MSRLLRRIPSVYTPTSQPSQPVIADGNIFFRVDPWTVRLFPSFSFCFLFLFLFLNLLLLRTPRTHKPSSDSHSRIYAPQAQQNSLQSALHRAAKHIPVYGSWYSSTFVSARVRQCKQADKSNSSVAESHHIRVFYFSFFPPRCCSLNNTFIKPPTINLEFFLYPPTLSPVTSRRLDYTIFLVWISV